MYHLCIQAARGGLHLDCLQQMQIEGVQVMMQLAVCTQVRRQELMMLQCNAAMQASLQGCSYQ